VIANPQRYGGDTEPTVPDPATVEFHQGRVAQDAKTIAVLDTGLAADVPFDVEPDPDLEPESQDSPAAGHGTMVAGVVARYAPTARILIRRVLNMPLGDADELEVAAALDALPHVDIVNASFSGPAAGQGKMLAFERAVDRLPEDTLVIAAAGNEGLDQPYFMAAFKRVLGVASAAEVEGQLGVCFYSNRGRWVDLSTQGSDVETVIATGQPRLGSGTSFAAPKIAAKVVEVAEDQGIGVRHAASWLMHESGGPAIAGGGTFVDMPTP
jgi:subtilisin family serine protease